MASPASTIAPAPRRAATIALPRPQFLSMVRGEALKLSRMRLTWVSLLVFTGFAALPLLLSLLAPRVLTSVEDAPAAAQLRVLLNELGVYASILRFVAVPIVIIVTARILGEEYGHGTIRVILARGVGRFQFLGVKLAMCSLVALALVFWGTVLAAVFQLLSLELVVGNFNLLRAINGDYWHAIGIEVLVLAIALEVAVLLVTAVTVLSRSLAVGMSAGLVWFLFDNLFGLIFFALAATVTRSTGWLLATGDLLGLNLNAMASALLPNNIVVPQLPFFGTPMVPVSGGHTLLVTAIYSAAFVVVSVALIVHRDVQE